MSDLVAEVMEAIRDLVPLDGGSHWSPMFSPQWPKDYSQSEIQMRRAIATTAVAVICAHNARTANANLAGISPPKADKTSTTSGA